MRRMRWTAIPLGMAALTIAAAVMHADGPSPDSAEITRLIRQLSDESYAVRESASAKLRDVGETAIPMLRAAARSNDLEIRLRIQRAVDQILFESKTTQMSFVLIAPGEFTMGSKGSEAGRQPDELEHQVRITESFLLGAREVTQPEFRVVMNWQPSRFAHANEKERRKDFESSTPLPVENVSWYDAVEFCNSLSQRDGFPLYYRISDIERSGDSIVAARVAVVGGHGYRLPTEAEWEYACRATTTTRFHFGSENTGREANVKPSYSTGGYGGATLKFRDLACTTSVASFPANQWGLSDMHGNVAEWCADWYDEKYYSSSPVDNPPGPNTGRHRVVRGGSWLVTEIHCRSASRFWLTPDEHKDHVGFRIARTPKLR